MAPTAAMLILYRRDHGSGSCFNWKSTETTKLKDRVKQWAGNKVNVMGRALSRLTVEDEKRFMEALDFSCS